ncbi:hypothetical protein J8J14_04950 [Roseomonas sp. SSH11]|uniref:DegT/DnrJ/EryC1/StrS aminotransferase family protein n=1 Tax=Pararoseomonas baculiformis TaxID=2820812 RepID=A0ABS4AAT8_9PROT|nr:hypothetical protein [Pararoseomonas baculiformis]MBP0444119.1 hypothetical protein [Pararoseomonas baculiformis]
MGIGGFLPLDPGPPLGEGGAESVAQRWFGGGVRPHAFRNGRSALALGACAAFAPIGTLWLPGFACHALLDAALAARDRGYLAGVATYPLNEEQAPGPDTGFLAHHLAPGDAVLVIAYFGQPASAALYRLAEARRDVVWIEDRAQALWPGPPLGDAILYSPRKLLGVPDGGYCVVTPNGADRAQSLPPQPPSAIPARPWPALQRFEEEEANERWFPDYRRAEAGMRVEPGLPSRITGALLARQDIGAIAAARRANHAVLSALIPDGFHLLPASAPAWVPYGFPVLVPDAAATSARMAEAGIFCPVIWPDPVEPAGCERTRSLVGRVLLLPLDQRYGPGEMRLVASAFRSASGSGSAAPRAA